MIGDSWGVPNYNPDFNIPPNAHTEFLLKNLGYNVFNYSINGGSMLDTITYAIAGVTNRLDSLNPVIVNKLFSYSLDEGTKTLPKPAPFNENKIDWVIWFHTEALRDQFTDSMFPFVKIEEAHNICSHICYRSFVKMLEIFGNPKTAVIGGQAPVDPILYQYHKPTFEIKDWRSEIVGRQLPRCYSFSKLDLICDMYDWSEVRMDFIDVHEKIMASMTDTNLFFDRCHPGVEPHKDLVARLDKIFKGEVAQTVRAMDS